MDKKKESEIANGLQTGDRQVWLQLYESYVGQVWKNVSRLMEHNPTAIADIVQETFLAAARSAKYSDPRRGSLWIWLWTIARRQVALYYRKQRPTTELNQARQWWATLDGEKIDWIDVKADMPPDILQSRELAILVRAALRQLPVDYQSLLLAKYVDNQPVERIAELTNCSQMAVRSKLARARKAFRKTFKKLIRTESDSSEVLL